MNQLSLAAHAFHANVMTCLGISKTNLMIMLSFNTLLPLSIALWLNHFPEFRHSQIDKNQILAWARRRVCKHWGIFGLTEV